MKENDSPPTPPAAIIFDLDGTLVDSSPDLAAAANRTREQFGMEALPLEIIRSYIGDGARKLVERSLGGDRHLREGLRFFRKNYHENCLVETRCYEGLDQLLAACAEIPLAICTNKPEEMAEDVVEGMGIRHHFRALVGARSKVPLKPAPDLLELSCVALDMEPSNVWMVGDSPNDVGVARALGAKAVGCLWGFDPIRLREAGPDWLLEYPAEFGQLLVAGR